MKSYLCKESLLQLIPWEEFFWGKSYIDVLSNALEYACLILIDWPLYLKIGAKLIRRSQFRIWPSSLNDIAGKGRRGDFGSARLCFKDQHTNRKKLDWRILHFVKKILSKRILLIYQSLFLTMYYMYIYRIWSLIPIQALNSM